MSCIDHISHVYPLGPWGSLVVVALALAVAAYVVVMEWRE